MQKIEKRTSYRRPFLAKISYGSDDIVGDGLIKDISLGGALVSTDRKIPVGTDVLLTVPYPKLSRYVSLRGIVVRIIHDGFAVSFKKYTEKHEAHWSVDPQSFNYPDQVLKSSDYLSIETLQNGLGKPYAAAPETPPTAPVQTGAPAPELVETLSKDFENASAETPTAKPLDNKRPPKRVGVLLFPWLLAILAGMLIIEIAADINFSTNNQSPTPMPSRDSKIVRSRSAKIKVKNEAPPPETDEVPIDIKTTDLPAPQRTDVSTNTSEQLTRNIQQLLTEIGYDPGPIDGLRGPRTTQAIKAFQSEHGLKADGLIDTELWDFLRIERASRHKNDG